MISHAIVINQENSTFFPDSMQIERESTEKCGGEYKRPAVSLQSKKSAPACATFKNDD